MMTTVSKHVIRDLMPLYLAGEASDDSRRLVDDFLRAHPEEQQLHPSGNALSLPQVALPDHLEMTSLDRTRKLYGHRSTALGAALAVSYAVFSFRFGRQGLTFVFFRDLPLAASWALLAAAAALWAVFLVLQYRWAATGLPPARGEKTSTPPLKILWMLGGAVAALPYAFIACYQFGLDDVRSMCVVGSLAGAAIGHVLHRRTPPPPR